MDIQAIFDKYGDDFNKILFAIEKDPIERKPEEWQELYDGVHEILKKLPKELGTGAKKTSQGLVKEVITLQKKIVASAVSFLFGEPVKLLLNDGDEEAFKLLSDVWDKNKLEYFNKKLARKVFIETKAAELWYVKKLEGQEAQIKVALLSIENGDAIYAHFDDLGNMDGFLRKYILINELETEVTHADIYTDTMVYKGTQKPGGWDVEKLPNIFSKIPVIYYSRKKPEWDDVQSEIDRMETLVSNFGDTNDYFGSPIIKFKGKPTDLPSKEEMGKMLQFSSEIDSDGKVTYPGDAEYLTWEQAPEAIRLEYDIIKSIIFSMTSTPDLSFDNVKGLSALSGIAIKLMFADSVLKAKDHEELFGEGLTRRNNLLKAILSTTSLKDKEKLEVLDIGLKFGSVLPTDLEELIKSISLARGGEAIMSEETAIRQNPLVMDADADIENLKQEKEAELSLGESFGV